MQPWVNITASEVPKQTSGYRRECRPECCTLPPRCKPSSQSHYSGPRNLRTTRVRLSFNTVKIHHGLTLWRWNEFLTSFGVVAVCGVVPWAEAFPVMHNHSRQIVGVASSVDGVTRVCAAVRFDVQNLVKGHVDADFLSVVPARPSAQQQGDVLSVWLHKPQDQNIKFCARASRF